MIAITFTKKTHTEQQNSTLQCRLSQTTSKAKVEHNLSNCFIFSSLFTHFAHAVRHCIYCVNYILISNAHLFALVCAVNSD